MWVIVFTGRYSQVGGDVASYVSTPDSCRIKSECRSPATELLSRVDVAKILSARQLQRAEVVELADTPS